MHMPINSLKKAFEKYKRMTSLDFTNHVFHDDDDDDDDDDNEMNLRNG